MSICNLDGARNCINSTCNNFRNLSYQPDTPRFVNAEIFSVSKASTCRAVVQTIFLISNE